MDAYEVTTIEEAREFFFLGKEFFAESDLASIEINWERVDYMVEQYVKAENYITFGIRDEDGNPIGFLIGDYYYEWFSDRLLVEEQTVFVTRDKRGFGAGVKLYDALIEWADRIGADEITISFISGINPPSFERLMERLGLEYSGSFFSKRFNK